MTSIELPAGGDLERAVRAFVAFETGFDAEAGGTGRHRTVGMCLGGSVAQRLNDGDVGTEFDRAERPGGFVSLDAVVDAPSQCWYRRNADHNVGVSVHSASLQTSGPEDLVQKLEAKRRDAERGDIVARAALARLDLLQLALLNAQRITVTLGPGAESEPPVVELPILDRVGRFLAGAAKHVDHAAHSRWANGMGLPYDDHEFAVERTVRSFVESIAPVLASARHDLDGVVHALGAFGSEYPELVRGRASDALRFTRQHLQAFLDVPNVHAAELETMLGRESVPEARGFDYGDAERLVQRVTREFRTPDQARKFGLE